jgi:inorganic pyrophosphatase
MSAYSGKNDAMCRSRRVPNEDQLLRIDLRPYLGRAVTVTVDRPLGSRHPVHDDIRYPLNYGYVAGTIAGDGEPIDAYVLGVDEPVREAHGIVIGLLLRADDVEDKLIVASAGKRFSEAEIRDLVDFQEQFFDSRIVLAADSEFGYRDNA